MRRQRWVAAAGIAAVATMVVLAGAALAPVSSGAATSSPTSGTFFRVEASSKGLTVLFTRCLGLGSRHEVVEHKVVTESGTDTVQKIPGRASFDDIVCERAITTDRSLADWRKEVLDGTMQTARANLAVVVFDASGTPVHRWNLVNAWPSQLTNYFDAAGGREVVTFVVEGSERVAT